MILCHHYVTLDLAMWESLVMCGCMPLCSCSTWIFMCGLLPMTNLQGNSNAVAQALATAITTAIAAGEAIIVGQTIATALTGGDSSQAQCFSSALSIAVANGGCSSVAAALAGEQARALAKRPLSLMIPTEAPFL